MYHCSGRCIRLDTSFVVNDMLVIACASETPKLPAESMCWTRCLQARFVNRIGMLLSDPMNTAGITSRWMSYLQQIDASLPNQVSSKTWIDLRVVQYWLQHGCLEEMACL